MELGDFVEVLRCSIPVDGKCLSIADICQRTSMGATTYEGVKRAQV